MNQRCIVFHILFSDVYSENLFREALNDQIGEEIINNIPYAADSVVLHRADTEYRNGGLNINSNKSKYMVTSKVEIYLTQLELH